MNHRKGPTLRMDASYALANIEDSLYYSNLDNWSMSKQIVERDGYEIYFTENIVELTRRHPETLEEQLLFRVEMDIASPMFAAFVKYVMNNPEDVTRTAIAQHIGEIE